MARITVAIIGAGLAGIAYAQTLQAAGRSPVVFDKSRGVAERLSTRRAEGGPSLDRGGQLVTARTPGVFRNASRRPTGAAEPRLVRTPGMSSIAKYLAAGLDIWLGVADRAVSTTAGGWRIDTGLGNWTCKNLVLAVPAP